MPVVTAEPERFGLQDATAFLRGRYDDRRVRLEPLSGGNWSTAFGFRHDGADLVARFGRHPEDYRKDAWAAQWSTPAVPIPSVVEVGPVDDDGWWFAVSTRSHGAPLESATARDWDALVPEVVDLIARVAALPYDPSQGVGRWGPDGHAPQGSWREFLLDVATDGTGHRIAGWRAALEAAPVALAAFDAGVAALADLADGLAPPLGVVHADLINANVLVRAGRITGVLDWGSAMYGDPLHDVAWLSFWAPWHPHLPAVALLERALADDRLTAGGDVERRLAAARLHIALGHVAYHAWAGDEAWRDRLASAVVTLVRTGELPPGWGPDQ